MAGKILNKKTNKLRIKNISRKRKIKKSKIRNRGKTQYGGAVYKLGQLNFIEYINVIDKNLIPEVEEYLKILYKFHTGKYDESLTDVYKYFINSDKDILTTYIDIRPKTIDDLSQEDLNNIILCYIHINARGSDTLLPNVLYTLCQLIYNYDIDAKKLDLSLKQIITSIASYIDTNDIDVNLPNYNVLLEKMVESKETPISEETAKATGINVIKAE